MKQQKRSRLPMIGQLLLWILACWLILMMITMGVTMRFSVEAMQDKIDDILKSTALTLAEGPTIQNIARNGVCDPEMADFMTDIVNNTDDLDYITVADANSIRLYHIDPAEIGKPFEGDDQHRALAGEVYMSDASPENYEDQRRAFHPILEEDGTVIGFVMTSATHHRIAMLRQDIYGTYAGLFATLCVFTLIFFGILAIYLGQQLRGVRPEDLVRAYLTQNDILDALEEGIVSFDLSGKIRLANAPAARMLGHREDLLVGKQVDDVLRAEDGTTFRDRSGVDVGIQSNRANVLVKPVELPDSNLWSRQVLVLVDKSELMRYAEDLGGTRHMVSALRANTHEFLNKAQVISGLLQMGYVEEAKEYIGSITRVHEYIMTPVMKLIHNPNAAALILAKAANFRELDIDMILLSNSTLPEHSRYLSTRELVLVVGNLLENAMEAVDQIPLEDLRSVVLQVTEDDKGLVIMVSDTGVGIEPEDLPHIFESGFSTKAQSGRGLGMKLIQEVVERHDGSIEVDTEPGSGTTISIIFSRERGAHL